MKTLVLARDFVTAIDYARNNYIVQADLVYINGHVALKGYRDTELHVLRGWDTQRGAMRLLLQEMKMFEQPQTGNIKVNEW